MALWWLQLRAMAARVLPWRWPLTTLSLLTFILPAVFGRPTTDWGGVSGFTGALLDSGRVLLVPFYLVEIAVSALYALFGWHPAPRPALFLAVAIGFLPYPLLDQLLVGVIRRWRPPPR